ncbi:MAG: M23 family metallopeptidase [Nitrospira sp.]|nr:M23 family metallopeptidase [Nitrospira sp.]
MGQTNSQEGNDAYTVVVFRGSTAKPLRFSFPRKLVRRLVIAVCVFLLADFLVISHYVVRTGEVWELSAFRAEAMSAREQTAAFSTAVEDLKKRIVAMKEVNQRLRVMLGIEVPKAGDMVNGRGGEDVPLPEGGGMPGKTGIIPNGMTPGGSGQTGDGAQGQQTSSTDEPTQENLQAATSVKEGLEWLSREATEQERILSELEQAAEQRSSRWASTPSIWPVKGWITSGFGPRVSPFTEKPTWHDGLDIGAPPNAPIQAPAQGRVTATGFDPKLGNLLKVDHGFGIETLYGHLAKSLVKEGQRVNRGDVIALVGSSGLSTGPHLHYMVKVNGQALDPTKYILE